MNENRNERRRREEMLAAENRSVERILDAVMNQVEEERDNLGELNNLMGVSYSRSYSKKTVRKLDEDRQYTRMCVKDLVFDLEVTRRENERLRYLLDNS